MNNIQENKNEVQVLDMSQIINLVESMLVVRLRRVVWFTFSVCARYSLREATSDFSY